MENKKTGLIVALDTSDRQQVESLVTALRDKVAYFKVGLQLFSTFGPEIVTWIKSTGGKVFADLKLHDIPNTVARAAVALTGHRVDMLNVHLSGGPTMVETMVTEVRKYAAAHNLPVPVLLGVTVLTSTSETEYLQLGYNESLNERVVRLAKMGRECGLDGVVASPREAALIREACGSEFIIVTPGIRPRWAAKNDQRRITTPGEALNLGANYLVVGRPIVQAGDPAAAADKILAEMEGDCNAAS